MDQPPAGEARPSDAVVAVVDRERLSAALAATHRAGFGPHARVLDGTRGDLAGQLRRAGWTAPLPPDLDPAALLVLITAPGRAARAADTLARAGARAVHLAARPVGAPVPPIPPVSPVEAPPPAGGAGAEAQGPGT